MYLCIYVPQQLVLQARLGHSEVDDCNFNTHLKDINNTHKVKLLIPVHHYPQFYMFKKHLTAMPLLTTKRVHVVKVTAFKGCWLELTLESKPVFAWCYCSLWLVVNKGHSTIKAGRWLHLLTMLANWPESMPLQGAKHSLYQALCYHGRRARSFFSYGQNKPINMP